MNTSTSGILNMPRPQMNYFQSFDRSKVKTQGKAIVVCMRRTMLTVSCGLDDWISANLVYCWDGSVAISDFAGYGARGLKIGVELISGGGQQVVFRFIFCSKVFFV